MKIRHLITLRHPVQPIAFEGSFDSSSNLNLTGKPPLYTRKETTENPLSLCEKRQWKTPSLYVKKTMGNPLYICEKRQWKPPPMYAKRDNGKLSLHMRKRQRNTHLYTRKETMETPLYTCGKGQ